MKITERGGCEADPAKTNDAPLSYGRVPEVWRVAPLKYTTRHAVLVEVVDEVTK